MNTTSIETLHHLVGVDLGQAQDPTAIAVVERRKTRGEPPICTLGHLERLPLGTPYPDVVRHLGTLLAREPLCAERDRWGALTRPAATLVVDHTGVGAAVTDMLHEAGVNPVRVLLHGGERETCTHGIYHVPKRDILIGLQVALEQGRLHVAYELDLADQLLREMLIVHYTLSQQGATFEHRGENSHADLVIAFALAHWYATGRRTTPTGPGKLVTLGQ